MCWNEPVAVLLRGGMLVWGQQGTQHLHPCNSYFAVLPQPFMRSLCCLWGLPTTLLPFPNPPYFDVFVSGLFIYPSASHCWGQDRADGHLCEPHERRPDGKGEVTRRCWWGGADLWARLIAQEQGMPRDFPHPNPAR